MQKRNSVTHEMMDADGTGSAKHRSLMFDLQHEQIRGIIAGRSIHALS